MFSPPTISLHRRLVLPSSPPICVPLTSHPTHDDGNAPLFFCCGVGRVGRVRQDGQRNAVDHKVPVVELVSPMRHFSEADELSSHFTFPRFVRSLCFCLWPNNPHLFCCALPWMTPLNPLVAEPGGETLCLNHSTHSTKLLCSMWCVSEWVNHLLTLPSAAAPAVPLQIVSP
jgi:hypothetical protein